MSEYILTPDGWGKWGEYFVPYFKDASVITQLSENDIFTFSGQFVPVGIYHEYTASFPLTAPETHAKRITDESAEKLTFDLNHKIISEDYVGAYYSGYFIAVSKLSTFNNKELPNFAETASQSWVAGNLSTYSGVYSLGYRTYYKTYPDKESKFVQSGTIYLYIPFFTLKGEHVTFGSLSVNVNDEGKLIYISSAVNTPNLRLLADATSTATYADAFYSAVPIETDGSGAPSWDGNTTSNSSHGYNGSGTLPDGNTTTNAGTDDNYGGYFPTDGSEPDARKNGLQIGKPENARESLYDGEMQTESFAPDRNFDIFKQVSGINMYYLNTLQIKEFYEDLWDEWNAIKNYFDNPMDSIISLSQLPFTPSSTGGAEVPITVGRTSMTNAKGYTVDRFQRESIFTNEYIDGFFNDFNDYSPKSKLSVYLPFSGWHELDIDKYLSVTAEEYASEIGNGSKENRMMRRKLSLYLDIDYASGIGKYIFYGELDSQKRMVLDTFTCNFANAVPLSAEDYRSKISNIIGMIGMTAGTCASIAMSTTTAGASMALMGGIVGNTKYGIQASKNNYAVQGSAQGSEGWLSPMDEVVFLLTHNRPYVAENFYDYTGRPDGECIYGNALGGFVKIQECYLETTATQEEINEIKTLLKEGCFFPHS